MVDFKGDVTMKNVQLNTGTEGAVMNVGTAEPCKWTAESNFDWWDSECGNTFVFIDGGPADNDFLFCPYCGGSIEH